MKYWLEQQTLTLGRLKKTHPCISYPNVLSLFFCYNSSNTDARLWPGVFQLVFFSWRFSFDLFDSQYWMLDKIIWQGFFSVLFVVVKTNCTSFYACLATFWFEKDCSVSLDQMQKRGFLCMSRNIFIRLFALCHKVVPCFWEWLVFIKCTQMPL